MRLILLLIYNPFAVQFFMNYAAKLSFFWVTWIFEVIDFNEKKFHVDVSGDIIHKFEQFCRYFKVRLLSHVTTDNQLYYSIKTIVLTSLRYLQGQSG